MKKNMMLICAAVMLALCFSVTSAFAIKEKCIALSMLAAGDNETEDMIVWLDSEGWFEVIEGEACCGEWTEYGGAFTMQFYDGCAPMLGGTKKRGFFECTGGEIRFITNPNGAPAPEDWNTYTIKKIKKKICTEMMEEDNNTMPVGSL